MFKEAFLNADGSLLGTVETNAQPGRVLRVWDAIREQPLSPAIPLGGASLRYYFDPTGARVAVIENNAALIYGVTSGARLFPPIYER